MQIGIAEDEDAGIPSGVPAFFLCILRWDCVDWGDASPQGTGSRRYEGLNHESTKNPEEELRDKQVLRMLFYFLTGHGSTQMNTDRGLLRKIRVIRVYLCPISSFL